MFLSSYGDTIINQSARVFSFSYFLKVNKGRHTRGSLLPQHAPATSSRGKAPSSAPTISSEKICCATKLLLPSFAPSYQTGLIRGSKRRVLRVYRLGYLPGSVFQEQAPSCVPALKVKMSTVKRIVKLKFRAFALCHSL